jgi:hypothetical protein
MQVRARLFQMPAAYVLIPQRVGQRRPEPVAGVNDGGGHGGRR